LQRSAERARLRLRYFLSHGGYDLASLGGLAVAAPSGAAEGAGLTPPGGVILSKAMSED
jgi:hypothetical protein